MIDKILDEQDDILVFKYFDLIVDYAGFKCNVEVDIPADTTVDYSYNVSRVLYAKIAQVEGVERIYIHVVVGYKTTTMWIVIYVSSPT